MVKDVKDIHVDRRRILLNTPHIKEASGAIANFKTDVPANLKKCVVEIDPVQDLHGYDYPWPPGGGKNLIPLNYGSKSGDGITYTVDDIGKFKASGTTSRGTNYYIFQNYYWPAGTYTLSIKGKHQGMNLRFRDPASSTNFATIYSDATSTSNEATFTVPEGIDGATLYFSQPLADVTVDIDAYIQIEKGSTATPYAPYSNICPISGRTEMEVWKRGKNLLPLLYIGYPGDKGWVNNSRVVATRGFYLRTGTYVLSTPDNTSRLYIVTCLNETTRKQPPAILLNRRIITIDSDGLYALQLNINFDVTQELLDTYNETFYLEYDSATVGYEPYNATAIPVTFPSEAGTVYGGTLDLLSGELVVDRAIVDLGTLNWNALSDIEMRARVPEYTRENSGWSESYTRITSNVLVVEDPDIVFVKRKAYDFTNKSQNYYNFDCKIPENTFADANAFKTWLNDIDGNGTHAVVSIPTATPITYQLTPQTIKSIRGVNNIWSDAGDTTVKYWGH